MRKFQFRLQSLLNYEGFKFQQTQHEAADIRRAILDCRQNISQLLDKLRQSQKALAAETQAGIESTRFLQVKAFQTSLGLEIDRGRQQCGELERKLQNKMKQLMARSVKKKSLENFKKRQQQAHYFQEEKKLEKNNQEMILMREARKRLR